MPRSLIATFNTGSSSLKFSVYAAEQDGLGKRLASGALRDIGADMTVHLDGLSAVALCHLRTTVKGAPQDPAHLLPALFNFITHEFPGDPIVAAAHRIVHGGRAYTEPCLATPEHLANLATLASFAPDHQPHNLAGVRSLAHLYPSLVQTLSFDTAFHSVQPSLARTYALPQDMREAGLMRYGFHGLSYAWLAQEAPNLLAGHPHQKIIALHLGGGASLCAMDRGQSIATSMGLTAMSGVPMSTRCGDIDPGVLLHMLEVQGLDGPRISDILNHESGLLGVSGLSGDVRALLASPSPAAKEALDLYAYRIVREIGSLAAAVEGVDALVFTGGVGENAPEIRRRICKALYWLGVELDETANVEHRTIISGHRSKVAIAIIAANEEEIIASEAMGLIESF